MKKFSVMLLLSFSLFSLPVQAQYYGSAFSQLQQTADDGQSATNSYSGGSYDYAGASSYAGYGFDTPSGSAPAVDLTGAGEHPTPQLLRNYGD